MNQYNPFALWLHEISGLGRETVRKFMSTTEHETIAEMLYTLPEDELLDLCLACMTSGRAEKTAKKILDSRSVDPARRVRQLTEQGISFCSLEDKTFPERLRQIPDPPYGIYYIGSLPDENSPSAAIIGARLASSYGRDQAVRFGSALSGAGVQIISGMARGIDGLAGTGALTEGGYSCAVLGCGVDICYPEENRRLYERLKQKGCLVSEYPPGTMPQARLFPPRNRLISGLSDVVLVIEAKKKSGTLITVDMALEQGKDVFVLPGRVTDSLSEGCNQLLNQGAGAALSPRTLLEYFYGDPGIEVLPGISLSEESGKTGSGKMTVKTGKSAGGKPALSPLETVLLQILCEQDLCPMNELIEEAGKRLGRKVSVREVMYAVSKLIRLELAQEMEVGVYARTGYGLQHL